MAFVATILGSAGLTLAFSASQASWKFTALGAGVWGCFIVSRSAIIWREWEEDDDIDEDTWGDDGHDDEHNNVNNVNNERMHLLP